MTPQGAGADHSRPYACCVTDLGALLDRVPALAGRPRRVSELAGGLSNRSYKVTTPDGAYVARIWQAGGFPEIDRDREYHNSVAAAAAGVGAPVVAYRPQDHLLVLRYIGGRAMTGADVAASLPRVADACRRLHAGPRFRGEFDVFATQRRYLAVVRERGLALPDGYGALAGAFAAAEQALAARPVPTVPCHNDLVAANIIDDGERLWLVDYEYSANNDPCFELGNLAGECGLPAAALAELVTCYYRRPLRGKIARARLFCLAAGYCWTLWGVVQQAASPPGAAFGEWAVRRYETVAAAMASPEFPRLLGEAQQED
jgi:thiamine kinase-like enzyme